MHIMEQARSRGLKNLVAVTADVVTLQPERQYDRVVSVEMFEHMKNYKVPCVCAQASRMLCLKLCRCNRLCTLSQHMKNSLQPECEQQLRHVQRASERASERASKQASRPTSAVHTATFRQCLPVLGPCPCKA